MTVVVIILYTESWELWHNVFLPSLCACALSMPPMNLQAAITGVLIVISGKCMNTV